MISSKLAGEVAGRGSPTGLGSQLDEVDVRAIGPDAGRVDKPEVVSHEDRTMMIGVLANLSAVFLGADENCPADAGSMRHIVGRYRSDLARQLGHAPSDRECWAALEAQVARLRESIGEEPG